MKQIQISPEQALPLLAEIGREIAEPLYRGLGNKAYGDYRRTGMLLPYDGCLSVGRAVCFSALPEQALSFCQSGLLIVTSRQLLDPQRRAIDTAMPGYDEPFIQKLDAALGQGKYDGYTLWDAICQQDTILGATFARRRPVTHQELIAEILLREDEQQMREVA